MAELCHLSFQGENPKIRNAKRQNDEITPCDKAKNATRNDKITPSEKAKPATRKKEIHREKTLCEKTPFENLILSFFRVASFHLFVLSHDAFSSFRLALFYLFAWRLFVFTLRNNVRRKDVKTKRRHTKKDKKTK